MKPSPYFADHFKYFFKRFSSTESLKKWFLKKAGDTAEAFDFPTDLKNEPRTIVFLYRDMERSSSFIKHLPKSFFKHTIFFAHESLHTLISAHQAKAIYYSDTECRYGEVPFLELEKKVIEFSPTISIYLGEAFFPRLYLSKKSGARIRMGFNAQALFPFVNVNLLPKEKNEAAIISDYYGVSNG